MLLAVVLYRLGWLLLFLSVGMISPAIFAGMEGDAKIAAAFIASGLASAFCGVGLILSLRGFRRRESMPVALTFVVAAWILMPFFAALPLNAAGIFPKFMDAYFEAVSALTTTGATLLDPKQSAAQSILIWRAILQWMGGLGVLVMASVVFIGILWPGIPITNAPMPGARQEGGLVERLGPAMHLILPVYAFGTFAAFLLFWMSGVPVFDALCLALSALSTGGMLPGTSGIDVYDAPLLPWLLGTVTGLAGLNIMLFRNLFPGRIGHFRFDVEARHYAVFMGMALLLCLTTVVLGWLKAPVGTDAIGSRIEDYGNALFLTVSLVSTSGFAPAQSGITSALPSPLILALVTVGGSVLSTAGGIKVIRIVLLLKHAHRELARLAHPHGVARVIYGTSVVDERVLAKVGATGIAMLTVFGGITMSFSFLGLTFDQATAATIAAMSNCGPAFAMATGLEEGFRALPEPARWVACAAMLFGRLEVLILVGVINPMYWRRM